MVNLEEKRAKFQKEYIEAQKKKRRLVTGIVLAVFCLSVGVFIWQNSQRYENPNSGNYFFADVPSYVGKRVEMTEIDLIMEGNQVKIPLEKIYENKIIYAEFPGDGKKVYYGDLKKLPLAAYVSSAGRLILATSICEPCYGTRFSLENKVLVCETCGTRWRNTDLFGLSGGCINYPPEELKYEVEGDFLVLEKDLLSKWQPRYFTDEMSGEDNQ